MSAFIKYIGPNGTYTHDVGEVDYQLSQQAIYTARQTPYAHRIQVTLANGMLVGTPAVIDSKIRQLVNAYRDGGDLLFYRAGGVVSNLSIRSSNSIGGIRVTAPPSFPTTANAGFITHLRYSITLEVDIPVGNQSGLLRSFTERVQRRGGGPRYGMLEPLTGNPVRQLLKQKTIFSAVQSGSAVGMYAPPGFPPPIWPAWLKESNPTVEESGGTLMGAAGTPQDFAVSWSYEFESTGPLTGSPAIWSR